MHSLLNSTITTMSLRKREMVRSPLSFFFPSRLPSFFFILLDIYMYDGEKWTSSGTSLPQPLQGSCAVEFAGQILLIAGKNEKDLWQGSKSVWQFDPENETWAHHQGWWPSTNWPHFYHGCSQAVVKGVPGEEQWNKMKRL